MRGFAKAVVSGIAAGLLLPLLVSSQPMHAAEADALIGSWKLISWQVIAEDGTAQDVFGTKPKGYLVLTREGRSIVLTTAEGRKSGTSDADRAALQISMLAYSGRYRVEGDDFVTIVEVSWNEAWNGSEQRRHFKVDGNRLFIESVPAPSITFAGKTDFRRIVWERER